jgi:hypothetical protein
VPERNFFPPTDSIPKSAGYSLPNLSTERYKTSSPTLQLPLCISARFSNPSRCFLLGRDLAKSSELANPLCCFPGRADPVGELGVSFSSARRFSFVP